jgi:hypothetical protein
MRVATLGALAVRRNHYGMGALEDRRSLIVLALPVVITVGFMGTIWYLHNRSFRR